VIDQLDTVLRELLVAGVPLASDDRVRFDPPDDVFRAYVDGTLKAHALNAYLVELRENRRLRAAAPDRWVENGHGVSQTAPARVDCHYLLSAWAPAAALAPGVEPTLGEHALLYAATAALLRAAPINPSRVLPAGSPELAAVDAEIRETDLPTTLLAPEGLPKLPEFWGTMGPHHRHWRPAIGLVVTLPVVHPVEEGGPIVTTRSATYTLGAGAETLVAIGGTVVDMAGAPVAGAHVRLARPGGATAGVVVTGDDGRFVFERLAPGAGYAIAVRAGGHPDTTRPVGIPEATGSYDVELA
jgi:hypothetical protein